MNNIEQFKKYKGQIDYAKPFKFFDLDFLAANVKAFEESWNKIFDNIEYFYSVKTCPMLEVLEEMSNLNWGMEVVSEYEFEWAYAALQPRTDILYNGLNKGERLIRKSLEIKSILFIDSEREFDILLKCLNANSYEGVKIGFRVALPLNGEAKQLSDFGLPVNSIIDKIETLKKFKVNASHIGFHGGSSRKDAVGYINSLKYILPVVNYMTDAFDECSLSIGGGFPSRHTFRNLDVDISKAWENIARDIYAFLNEHLKDFKKTTLILEPGRALVEDCGYICGSIISRKHKNEFIDDTLILNIGMNEIPSIKRKYHEFHLLENKSDVLSSCKIRGNLCFEEDIFFEQIMMPQELDLPEQIFITGTGSYDVATSYSWSHATLPYVFVKNQKLSNPQFIKHINKLYYE